MSWLQTQLDFLTGCHHLEPDDIPWPEARRIVNKATRRYRATAPQHVNTIDAARFLRTLTPQTLNVDEVAAVAAMLGVSRRKVYRRLHDRKFRQQIPHLGRCLR